jgi:hypothetical protein
MLTIGARPVRFVGTSIFGGACVHTISVNVRLRKKMRLKITEGRGYMPVVPVCSVFFSAYMTGKTVLPA